MSRTIPTAHEMDTRVSAFAAKISELLSPDLPGGMIDTIVAGTARQLLTRDEQSGEWAFEYYVFPGGYDIAYYDAECSGPLCASCALGILRRGIESWRVAVQQWLTDCGRGWGDAVPNPCLLAQDMIVAAECCDCWEENQPCEVCGRILGPCDEETETEGDE